MDPADLGLRIRRARERKRWSQARLAKEVGVGVRTVGRWERGEVEAPRSSIGALDQVLGIDLDGGTEVDPIEEQLRELIHDMPPKEIERVVKQYKESRDSSHAERAG